MDNIMIKGRRTIWKGEKLQWLSSIMSNHMVEKCRPHLDIEIKGEICK